MTERDMQGWAHELELEHRYEYEQGLLRADPGYAEFLNKLERENAESE